MGRRSKKETLNLAVEQALFRKATGYSYIQQDSCKVKHIIYGENGKKLEEIETLQTIDVEKYVTPEYSAIALWLKARMPEKWGDAAANVLPQVTPIIDNIPLLGQEVAQSNQLLNADLTQKQTEGEAVA